MGDRTSVTLTVLTSQAEEAAKHFDEENNDYYTTEDKTHYEFYEVNYGTLSFLDKLQNNGIAYDSHWQAGSEYGSGANTCRFTPEGDSVVKDICDSYERLCIYDLMEKLNDYEALKKLITDRHDEIFILPWDNQEEYGKIFKLKQLINPT